MKKLIVLISLLSTVFTYAQTGSISGKLLDKEYNNEPLAFANILIKGTSTGTTSDFDGIQRPSATVTANFNHMRQDPACRVTTNTALWHNTVVCDENVKVALVRYKSLTPSNNFQNVRIKVQEISQAYEFIPEDSTTYTSTLP